MTKVRGPKDGKNVTARFDGTSKSNFPALSSTIDLVLLSIQGNEYCSGDYLGAIIAQARKTHKFTTLLIADEVYWHNLQSSIAPQALEISGLKRKALELGDKYIQDNLKYFLMSCDITPEQFNQKYPNTTASQKIEHINQLAKEKSLNFEVVRWTSWVSRKNYATEIQPKIQAFYSSNESLTQSITKTAEQYAERHFTAEDPELIKARSIGYTAEETPAIVWLAAALNYNFIVYPGERPKSFKTAMECFVKNSSELQSSTAANPIMIYSVQPKTVANWLEVHFERSFDSSQRSSLGTNSHSFFTQELDSSEVQSTGSDRDMRVLNLAMEKILESKLREDIKLKFFLELVKHSMASNPPSPTDSLSDSENNLELV